MTKVLLRNLEFEIELYLVRQISENTDRVVSGLIFTKVLLRNLELEIELYLVKQITRKFGRLYLDWHGSKTIYWSRALTT